MFSTSGEQLPFNEWPAILHLGKLAWTLILQRAESIINISDHQGATALALEPMTTKCHRKLTECQTRATSNPPKRESFQHHILKL